MGNTLFTENPLSIAENQEDILSLSQILALPKIHYADIYLQEQLPNILSRWPLLAEFADISNPHSAGSDDLTDETV